MIRYENGLLSGMLPAESSDSGMETDDSSEEGSVSRERSGSPSGEMKSEIELYEGGILKNGPREGDRVLSWDRRMIDGISVGSANLRLSVEEALK